MYSIHEFPNFIDELIQLVQALDFSEGDRYFCDGRRLCIRFFLSFLVMPRPCSFSICFSHLGSHISVKSWSCRYDKVLLMMSSILDCFVDVSFARAAASLIGNRPVIMSAKSGLMSGGVKMRKILETSSDWFMVRSVLVSELMLLMKKVLVLCVICSMQEVLDLQFQRWYSSSDSVLHSIQRSSV